MLLEIYELSPDSFNVLKESLSSVPFPQKELESDWNKNEIENLSKGLQKITSSCAGSPLLEPWISEKLEALNNGTLYQESMSGKETPGNHPWRFNMDVNRLSEVCSGIFLKTHGSPNVIEIKSNEDAILELICRKIFSEPLFNVPIEPEILLKNKTIMTKSLIAFGGNYVSTNRFLVFTGDNANWPKVSLNPMIEPQDLAKDLMKFYSIYSCYSEEDIAFLDTIEKLKKIASEIAQDLENCKAHGKIFVTSTINNTETE